LGRGLSCYIARMMPSPVTYWLQQIVMAIILIGLIVLLTLWPARHVLKPLWPPPVDEYILSAEADRGERLMLSVGAAGLPERNSAIARSRPHHVVVLERRDEAPLLGFIAGYRETPDAPLSGQLPEALKPARVELPLHADWILVVNPGEDALIELPVAELVAFYRPNQLSLSERLSLMVSRVAIGIRRP
jgi:ABC-type phosphate transport system auxiliary subunit